MNNSIDLGQIYGFNNCANGSCSYKGNMAKNIPSLEEIAYYNLSNENSNYKYDNKEIENISENATARDISYDGLSRNYIVTEQGNNNTLTPQLPQPITTPSKVLNNINVTSMIPVYNQPYPVTGESIQYLNGFMRTQVGRRIEVDFLIGSDDLVTKTGFLLGVGANYILINELGTSNLTSCDFYNIKFVTYFYD